MTRPAPGCTSRCRPHIPSGHPGTSALSSLSGGKRTSPGQAKIDANDPKQTSLSLDALVTAFRREAGFVEGQNVAVECCRADNQFKKPKPARKGDAGRRLSGEKDFANPRIGRCIGVSFPNDRLRPDVTVINLDKVFGTYSLSPIRLISDPTAC